MKRSEAIEIIKSCAVDLKITNKDNKDYFSGDAHYILKKLEEAGMLPPERPDESPVGYGAAYLSDEEVMKNYFKFKHSWEPEDD